MDKLCPCCGSSLVEYKLGDGNYSFKGKDEPIVLMTCQICMHHCFSPCPDDETLARIYSGSYFGTGEEEYFNNHYHEYNVPLANDIVAIAKEIGLKDDFRMHEFGCGIGTTVNQLGKMGVNATGSDWSTSAITYGQKMGNSRINVGSKEEIDKMANEKMDLVFTSHVIEHLTNPISFLEEIGKFGKGTYFYSRLPNGYDFITKNFSMLISPWFYYPHHLQHFSPDSLTALLKRAGFRVIYVRSTLRSDNEVTFMDPKHWPAPTFEECKPIFQKNNESEELEFLAIYEGKGTQNIDDILSLPKRHDNEKLFHHRADNMSAFPNKDTGWNWYYSTNVPELSGEMIYFEPENRFYYDDTEYCPAWLAVNTEKFTPITTWRAKNSGIVEVKLTAFPMTPGLRDAKLQIFRNYKLIEERIIKGAYPTQVCAIQLEKIEMRARDRLKFVINPIASDKANGKYGIFVEINQTECEVPFRFETSIELKPVILNFLRRAKGFVRRLISIK